MPYTQTLEGMKKREEARRQEKLGKVPVTSKVWDPQKKRFVWKLSGWEKKPLPPTKGGATKKPISPAKPRTAGEKAEEIRKKVEAERVKRGVTGKQPPAGERAGSAIRGATELNRLTDALSEQQKKGKKR